ncbi:DUF1801 domain-containing protein [Sphingosinicella sp. YJ22]|uniref:DUF1801 domain-containing protein n=1 Tax=Sphingosinicella sp. YJ22 TaxID=1104780 RepID=UPI00140A83FD|nr:DUF1801 domain-containing protein [Sphingosinicella sp. YJ22]
MAENKTKPTAASVADFLDAVPNAQRREDGKKVCAMMERLSGYPPVLWGPSIVGFGSYHYRYESGREGDAGRIGFSPRSTSLVLYLVDGYRGKEAQLARLGKHKIGVSCLYISKLADVDLAVLEEMITDSLAYMDEKYPRAD